MKIFTIILLYLFVHTSCSQNKNYFPVGGPWEGHELSFDFNERELSSVDTLPEFETTSPKLKLTGTVYKPDGNTPAKDIILYIYHTNRDGIYPRHNAKSGAYSHGYIKGWIKTNDDGEYEFYTFRPGIYPSRSGPAHIHLEVMEPNGKHYWLESYHFSDDPLIGKHERSNNLRGGDGSLLELSRDDSILVGNRDIILGKNVPGYE